MSETERFKPKRMLRLAKLLDKDAKNKKGVKFDMGVWGYVTNPEAPMSCGTTACAMGLAALSGEFKREGLSYKIKTKEKVGEWGKSHTETFISFRMNRRSIDGISAASKLFGITYQDASQLFLYTSGEGARVERSVAKKLRKYVEKHRSA